MKQPELLDLFGKDCRPSLSVRLEKFPAQVGKFDFILGGVNKLQDFRGLHNRDSFAEVLPDFVRNVIDVIEFR